MLFMLHGDKNTKGGDNNMKKIIATIFSFAALLAVAAPASASEHRDDAFVCPVITTDAVLNSPKGASIEDGHYTIGGPIISIPEHATNGDGEGVPDGEHSAPGDTDYTAVWYGSPPQN
jgi:hypothetical protein